MLFRFCLYGFLKNQQYYDPFIILALREKGLSFFVIGVLLSFRHICTNVLQIPTGILADIWGRKRSMILSFSAYIASFLLYGFSKGVVLIAAATLFFAIGESFRSGTHKAMIFTWLKEQGRENEKARFYGLTRSWSQLGSALSVVISSAIVFFGRQYSWIFFISIIPYVAGIINILGYPASLDGTRLQSMTVKAAIREMIDALKIAAKNAQLRQLFAESMVFKGSYTVTNQYLQPLLKTSALALPFMLGFANEQRAAIMVGSVYFILYLLSSEASRSAHTISTKLGGDNGASRLLWRIQIIAFAVMIPALLFNNGFWAVPCFLIIAVMQNVFRPLFMSRLDEASDADLGATILSIDAQLESILVMIAAPLIGFAVDHFHGQLWPVGMFGSVATLGIMLFIRLSRGKPTPGVSNAVTI